MSEDDPDGADSKGEPADGSPPDDRPADGAGEVPWEDGSARDDTERGHGPADADERAPLSDLADRLDDDRLAPADGGPETGDRGSVDAGEPWDGRGDGPWDERGDGPQSGDPDARPAERSDAPLSDLARAVETRRSARTESDPFEEVDVDDVDSEVIWESLASDDGGITAAEVGMGAEASRVDPGAAGATGIHVVPKDAYCQRCRFLSDPPEVTCTHEGTDIVEVVDSERFRVQNCPYADAEIQAPDDE